MTETKAPEIVAPAAAPEQWEVEWRRRLDAFGKAVDRDPAKIEEKLVSLTDRPGPKALTYLTDENTTALGDLRAVLCDSGVVPLAALKANLHLLRGQFNVTAGGELATTGGQSAIQTRVIPALPIEVEGEKFMAAIKIGGEQKVGVVETLCAVKALLAFDYGIFNLPNKLLELVERHADELDEPWTAEVYATIKKIKKVVSKSRYAELLEALDMPGADFVTKARKNAFLNKVQKVLIPAVKNFHNILLAWQENWIRSSSNPAHMQMAIMAGFTGAEMPSSVIRHPDTGPVRDAVDGVTNAINKCFTGPGIIVARALGQDVMSIKELLMLDGLPKLCGVENRELLLKALGITATATDVRRESNIARYIYAVQELPNVPQTAKETTYLDDLLQVGEYLWPRSGGASEPTRRTGTIAVDGEDDEEDDDR